MKKSKKIVLIIVSIMLLISPIIVSAKTESNNSFFYIAAKKSTTTTSNSDSFNNKQTCSGDNSILGSVNDENSVAWLLQTILDYIRIVGPILVVVLSGVEFAKVIIESDDEAMAKAKKKLITRLILVGCLFLIPTLVSVALNMFGITSNATCNIK